MFQLSRKTRRLLEAPSPGQYQSIQCSHAMADWTTNKPCHDPCFAHCEHLLHIRTEIQDPSPLLQLTCLNTQRTFSVRLSSDHASAAVGQAGVGTAHNQKAESM